MKGPTLRMLLLSACLCPLGVQAVDLPQPKSGLWETRIKLTSSKNSAPTIQVLRVCVDASTAARDKSDADKYVKDNCKKSATKRIGADWVTDSVCSLGASVVTGHMVLRFSGENAYRVQTDTKYAPALAGATWTRMEVDAKRLGTCKP